MNSWQVIVYADPLLRSSPTLSSTISLSVDTTAEAETLCNGGSPFSINCVEENVESPNKSVKDLWLEYAKSSNMHVIKSFRQRQLASSLQLQSQEERDKDNFNPFSSALDRDGNSLLTWAAGNGNLELRKYLVDECGMDPRHAFVERRGRTGQPLHWAARNNCIDICKWLILEKDCDVNCCTDNGTVPLHFSMGHLDLVKWLTEEVHCNINHRNIHGCNASHWCAFNGDVNMFIYLQSKGLEVHHINGNKRSALHKAAVKGNVEVCRWLLEDSKFGYEHMQPDIEGDTPMSLAKSCGNLELEVYLMEWYERFA